MDGFTPGPWEYVASTKDHGPYVSGPWGGDICDCYVMSNPQSPAVCNGGDSRPVHHQADRADANAKLIAAAPEMYAVLRRCEDYFKNIADADGRSDGSFVGNEEMHLLVEIQCALPSVQSADEETARAEGVTP